MRRTWLTLMDMTTTITTMITGMMATSVENSKVAAVTAEVFGDRAPLLLCEPGRAMVADAFCLVTRVKALREDGSVFLNDGTYGALAEARDIGPVERYTVVSPQGAPRSGAPVDRVVFGPTCDSLDRLPDAIALPGDMRPGDYVMFEGMGAYSRALATGFNGYGPVGPVTVSSLN